MVNNLSPCGYTKKGKRANTMSKYIFSVDIYSQIWVASGIGFDWALGEFLPLCVKNVAVVIH